MIAGGELRPFRVALRAPLETAAGRIASRTGVLLVLRDRTGRLGFGEAAPLPGRRAARVERACDVTACSEALSPLLGELEGCDPEGVLRDARFAQGPPAARFALECALVDLASQARGVRAADWLAGGRAPHAAIPVNALIGGGDTQAVAAAGARALAAGYGSFKLKVGMHGPGRERERVAALRAAVGPDARIRLDANGAWDPALAGEILAALAANDIEYLEDPIDVRDARDVARLAALRGASPVPLAADACTADPDCVREILATRAVDRLVLKPPSLGGLRATRCLVRDAAAAGIGCVLTSSIDTAFGLTATLQLAAALPGQPVACGLGTADWLADDLARPPPVRAGLMALPEAVGMGVAPTAAPSRGAA